MYALDNTTRKVEVVLAGAITTNQLMCTASFKNVASQDSSDDAADPTTNTTLTNGATAVTLIPLPTQSAKREIENMTIHNADTASATVTVRLNDNGTSYTLFKAILATLETMVYERGTGWNCYTSAGSLKNST